MRRAVVVAAAAALLAVPLLAQTAGPLAPLAFLVGEWRAIDTPPGERGSFSFRFDVQNHLLVRTNEAVYDATASRPASRHDDLMVVFAEDGALKAEYFDSEGHVIRYTVQPGPSRVVFVSAAEPRAPRYRLTYALANGVLSGSFEVAPPDAPDAFKPYLTWKAKK